MQSIKTFRHLPLSVFARRPSVLKPGSFRFDSRCLLSVVKQQVPVSVFRVDSRHFSLSSDESVADLPVFDADTKLVVQNGMPFTGHGQLRIGKSIYTGDFVDGKRHGVGVNKGDSGILFEGEWKNGSMDGQGTITDAMGNITTQGIFRKSKLFTGKGFHRSQYGTIYEGEMLEGKRHGQGKITTSKNGLAWEGQLKLGEPFTGKGLWGKQRGVWVEGVFTAEKQTISPTNETKTAEVSNCWDG